MVLFRALAVIVARTFLAMVIPVNIAVVAILWAFFFLMVEDDYIEEDEREMTMNLTPFLGRVNCQKLG